MFDEIPLTLLECLGAESSKISAEPASDTTTRHGLLLQEQQETLVILSEYNEHVDVWTFYSLFHFIRLVFEIFERTLLKKIWSKIRCCIQIIRSNRISCWWIQSPLWFGEKSVGTSGAKSRKTLESFDHANNTLGSDACVERFSLVESMANAFGSSVTEVPKDMFSLLKLLLCWCVLKDETQWVKGNDTWRCSQVSSQERKLLIIYVDSAFIEKDLKLFVAYGSRLLFQLKPCVWMHRPW